MDQSNLPRAVAQRLGELAKTTILQNVPITQAPYVIKGAPTVLEAVWHARRLAAPVRHVLDYQYLVKNKREIVNTCPLCGSSRIRILFSPSKNRADGTLAWKYNVGQCADCGLLRRFPAIKVSRVADLYAGKAYNAFLSGDYSADRRRRYRYTLDSFGAHLGKGDGRRLLDFGCGNGLFLEMAEERGYKTWGIDLGPDNIAAAKQRLGRQDRLYAGDVDEVPEIAEGGFDVITMWSVLAHLGDPVAVISRVRQLLNPGGVLMIFTVNAQSLQLRALHSKWVGFTRNHLVFFDHRTLPLLMKKAGFEGVGFRMFYGETIEARTTLLTEEQARRYRYVVDANKCGNMMRAVAINGSPDAVPIKGLIDL